MNRTVAGIITIGSYFAITFIIAVPFVSNLEIEKANACKKEYRWGNADNMYNKAININSFNAEYLKEYSNFIIHKTQYQKNDLLLLKRSTTLYESALRLNPNNVEYWTLLGSAMIKIYKSRLRLNDNNGVELKIALNCFKKAVALDPNGFNTFYKVGSAGMDIWQYLDKNEREFVLVSIKQNIDLSHAYSWEPFIKHIYQKIWNLEKTFDVLLNVTPDNLAAHARLYWFITQDSILWKYRKEQADRVNYYKQKENPEEFFQEKTKKTERVNNIKEIYKNKLKNVKIGKESIDTDVLKSVNMYLFEWQGMANNEMNEYKNGNMYWSGSIYTGIFIPAGNITLHIKARGSRAKNIWPYMIVELDGNIVGEMFVDDPDWKSYDFDINTDGGVKVLSVTFPNDYCHTVNGVREDRNLYLGDVRIESITERGAGGSIDFSIRSFAAYFGPDYRRSG